MDSVSKLAERMGGIREYIVNALGSRGTISRCGWLVAIVACMVVAVGCATDKRSAELIAYAEEIAMELPDSALRVVQSIDPKSVRGKHDRAHYKLVVAEAHYYNRLAVDRDTIAQPLFDYYIESDNHAERARALYQHALVMQAAGKMPEAMHSLLLAEESCHKINNPRLEGLVHRTKASIYGDGYLFRNAYESHNESYDCFKRANLTEHCAYAMLDMGCALINSRHYQKAEPLLIEVRDYAIEQQNKWLLCEVLHNLAELYTQVEDYDKCEATISLFDTQNCLLNGKAFYYSVKAICAANRHDEKEAYENIAIARSYDEFSERVEYASYAVYRAFDDTQNALSLHEINKHRQDSTVLRALEQPILNVQVELLQKNLDSERRERSLIRQRNIMIYVGIAILVVVAILYIWYRMRRKNRDIAQYVETIKELQLANRNLPDEMNASIGALYRDRFSELNELCDIYYDHSGSSRQKTLVYDKLSQTITSIKNDRERLDNMEEAVNRYRHNLMAQLREQMPKLSERDMRIALYSFAGFSNRAIALFIDSDPITVSKMKYNLKQKIKRAETDSQEMLCAALSEK